MANKNYQRGRAKEYRIAKKYRELGYTIVQRTAGSHSPFDIIAVSRFRDEVMFIQVKPKKFSDKKRELIEKENSWLNKKLVGHFVIE